MAVITILGQFFCNREKIRTSVFVILAEWDRIKAQPARRMPTDGREHGAGEENCLKNGPSFGGVVAGQICIVVESWVLQFVDETDEQSALGGLLDDALVGPQLVPDLPIGTQKTTSQRGSLKSIIEIRLSHTHQTREVRQVRVVDDPADQTAPLAIERRT